MQEAARAYSPKGIDVAPYAAEVPLRILLTIIGLVLWVFIVVSIIGLFYGIILGLFFFFAHLILIAHVRGSSIKLGPQQMPGLYNRVVDIAQRMGMKRVPDVYLQQSGGVLNAFATRLGRRRFVVLFSDLVKACGENLDALDFIIAHELGHIHRGHLNWRWLHWPALFIPFLGTAYSRACEYTCDRYGFQAPSDPRRSLDGLCILAAGPQFVPFVNKQAFVAQRDDLNTAFMKLASWFSTHPPLSRRVGALSPDLAPQAKSSFVATFFALVMALVLFVVPVAGGVYILGKAIQDVRNQFASQMGGASYITPDTPCSPGEPCWGTLKQ
jgi:Zn-dependent protease with chaperone function